VRTNRFRRGFPDGELRARNGQPLPTILQSRGLQAAPQQSLAAPSSPSSIGSRQKSVKPGYVLQPEPPPDDASRDEALGMLASEGPGTLSPVQLSRWADAAHAIPASQAQAVREAAAKRIKIAVRARAHALAAAEEASTLLTKQEQTRRHRQKSARMASPPRSPIKREQGTNEEREE
jgi:hypothetical protein